VIAPRTDIGANLLHPQFDPDREIVMQRAQAAGVTRLLITCTDLAESARGVAFCRGRSEPIWCTAGVHPHNAKDTGPHWLAELTKLVAEPEVKAVGETGLDFNRNFSPQARQIEVFRAQLEVATTAGKPAFVHDRDTHGKVFEILRDHAAEVPGVVVHCFTGTRADLTRFLDAGFYIGITGWVCDERRGQPLRDIVSDIPLDQLLVETDAPFLYPHNAPENAFGSTDKPRNEPSLLNFVIDKLAELYRRDPVEIASATHRNASILFNLSEDS